MSNQRNQTREMIEHIRSSSAFSRNQVAVYEDIPLKNIFKTINETDPITFIYQPSPIIIDACNRLKHPNLITLTIKVLDNYSIYGVTNIQAKPSSFTLDHLVINELILEKNYPMVNRIRHAYELLDLVDFFWAGDMFLVLNFDNIVYQEGETDSIVVIPNNIKYLNTYDNRKQVMTWLLHILAELLSDRFEYGTDINPLVLGIESGNVRGVNMPNIIDQRVLSFLLRFIKDDITPQQLLNDSLFAGFKSPITKVSNPVAKTPSNPDRFSSTIGDFLTVMLNDYDEYPLGMLFLAINIWYRACEMVLVNDFNEMVRGVIILCEYYIDERKGNLDLIGESHHQIVNAIMEELKYVIYMNPYFYLAADLPQLVTTYKYIFERSDIYINVDIVAWYKAMKTTNNPSLMSKQISIDEFFNMEV